MHIALIGTGNIGGTLARHLSRAGHTLILASGRPATAMALAEELGSDATAAVPAQAAVAGDAVVLAVPGAALDGLLDELGEALDGRVVVDATNPYGVDRGLPQGQWLQQRLPTSRVVRAFNTLYWTTLRDAAFRVGPDRLAMVLSGDREDARAKASTLIDSVGFAAVDLGPMSGVWRQEPDGPLYTVEMTEPLLRQHIPSPQRGAA